MPPKKKDNPAKLADKENLARAEAEVLGLQRLLELRSYEAVESRRSERLWRERLDAFQLALQQQKEDTHDITSDMGRQYKAMQEQMGSKMSNLEKDNQALKKTIEDKDAEIKALKAELAALNRAKEQEVAECSRRMEEMQLDFSHMLRDTLDKMHDRLAKVQGLA